MHMLIFLPCMYMYLHNKISASSILILFSIAYIWIHIGISLLFMPPNLCVHNTKYNTLQRVLFRILVTPLIHGQNQSLPQFCLHRYIMLTQHAISSICTYHSFLVLSYILLQRVPLLQIEMFTRSHPIHCILINFFRVFKPNLICSDNKKQQKQST